MILAGCKEGSRRILLVALSGRVSAVFFIQHFFADSFRNGIFRMEKCWQNLLYGRGVWGGRMYKILIGLIVVAVVALLAIRMMPRSKPPAEEILATMQREAMANAVSIR